MLRLIIDIGFFLEKMSPDISDDIDLTSYKFEDSNECIIVNLYANGAIEQKDIEVLNDSDSLEVSIPSI